MPPRAAAARPVRSSSGRMSPALPLPPDTAPRPPRQSARVSVEVAEAEDAPEGDEGVPEADLLPLLVGAPGVGDGHLVDAPAGPVPGHLGGDLGLEAEAVGLERKALEDLFAEDLVAGL